MTQKNAIRHFYTSNYFFTLLHGPPGTGKKQTDSLVDRDYFQPTDQRYIGHKN